MKIYYVHTERYRDPIFSMGPQCENFLRRHYAWSVSRQQFVGKVSELFGEALAALV